MQVKDIYTLANMHQINHLMDAETVIISTDTRDSDELTADKLSQLFDAAWGVMHARHVKRGNLLESDHDATVERLVYAFRKWVASCEVTEEDING